MTEDKKEPRKYPYVLSEDLSRTVRNALVGIEKASGREVFAGIEATHDPEKFVVHLNTLKGPIQVAATKEGRWMGHWNLRLADGTESEMPAHSLDAPRPFWKRIMALCVDPVDWLRHRMERFDTTYFRSDDHSTYKGGAEEFQQIKKEVGKLSEPDKRRLKGAQNAEQWGIR